MSIKHLAIILDGNRRWARSRNLPTFEGHRRGYDRVKEVGDWCLARRIKYLTVYAFSTENWKRSQEEVGYLMDLLYLALTKEVDYYVQRNIRLRVIGRRRELSDKLIKAINEAEDRTKNNTAAQINLCINYGGRAEIVAGVQKLIDAGISSDKVTEEIFADQLWTAGLPDPELIIRTSGEHRLSGFLTWSGVYSELLFIDKHWPDFAEQDLDDALTWFSNRSRRFGGDQKK
ncbi:MAG: polyprenyl diphosphate synthase [Candidatus Uhrbacteria bacterium]